jgi:hypothetical protein
VAAGDGLDGRERSQSGLGRTGTVGGCKRGDARGRGGEKFSFYLGRDTGVFE